MKFVIVLVLAVFVGGSVGQWTDESTTIDWDTTRNDWTTDDDGTTKKDGTTKHDGTTPDHATSVPTNDPWTTWPSTPTTPTTEDPWTTKDDGTTKNDGTTEDPWTTWNPTTETPSCGMHKPPKYCTKPGPMCENCDTLVTCIEVAEDTFVKTINEHCPSEGKRCVVDSCSHRRDPICDGLDCIEFPCTGTGVFPDQFDCTQYHVCIVDEDGIYHEKKTCDAGYRYNAKTTYCDQPADTCNGYPVPICGEEVITAALPENPSIYYSCYIYQEVRYPVLFLCPHGGIFQHYQCVDQS